MRRTTQMALLQWRNVMIAPSGLLGIGLLIAIAIGAWYGARLIPIRF